MQFTTVTLACLASANLAFGAAVAQGPSNAKLSPAGPKIDPNYAKCGADRYGLQYPRDGTKITLDGKNKNGFKVPILYCSTDGSAKNTYVDVTISEERSPYTGIISGKETTTHQAPSTQKGVAEKYFKGYYFDTVVRQSGGYYPEGKRTITVFEQFEDKSFELGTAEVEFIVKN